MRPPPLHALLPLVLSGCLASSSLFEGPAVWAVSLSGSTELFGLLPARLGLAAAVVADVDPDTDLEQALVDGADATLVLPSRKAALQPTGESGLYLSDPAQSLTLFAPPDSEVAVTVAFDGVEHTLSTRTHEAAVAPDFEPHPAGKRLVIPVRRSLEKVHHGVLTQVFDDQGAVVWDDFPKDALGWIDVIDGEKVPREVVVPGAVFEEPGLYTVAVFALREDLDQIERSAGLTSRLSGFSTGSALITPLQVVAE